MNLLSMYIGEKVKYFRESIGWSQTELAEQIEMTRVSIANIESGRQNAPLLRLYDIAIVFGCELSDLLPPIDYVKENRHKKVKKVITFEFED